MVGFRVTKYDPSFRDAAGAYRRDEWTSVSDIGRSFDGKVLTSSTYVGTESAYVESVRLFMRECHQTVLRIVDLQLNDVEVESMPALLAQQVTNPLLELTNQAEVSGDDVDRIVRLALRENIWCRLEGTHGFYVHFGHDFYMYVGGTDLTGSPPLLPPEIFAEVYESPYIRE